MNKPAVQSVPAHINNYSKNIYSKTGITMHWIVGTLASAGVTFQNPSRQASAHYGIGKNGEIHQFVEDKYTAFHAGVSKYNQSHLAIEHEGGQLVSGQRVKPSTACHAASAKLVAWLCKTYNIPCNRKNIIKHSETGYATECSGSLDIDLIVSEANKILNSSNMWSISKESYERGKTQFRPYLEKWRPDVIKAGVDTMEWLIRHGTSELPNQIDKLNSEVKNRDTQISNLNKTVGTLTADKEKLQIELNDKKKALEACQNSLDNNEPYIRELQELNNKLQNDLTTLTQRYNDLHEEHEKCKDNQRVGTLAQFFNWLKNILKK